MYIRYQFKYTGKAYIMLDILPRIRELITENTEFAMATVVKTWRSSPRQPGSCLIVTKDGDMIGSVSGGCVENAVVKKALKVLETGVSELVKFGVANEDAWEVGLSCGGEVWVHVSRFYPAALWVKLDESISTNQGLAIVTNLNTGDQSTFISSGTQPDGLMSLVAEEYVKRNNTLIDYQGTNYFIHSFPPKNKMLLIGSAHITAELIDLAHTYGFETIVIDPRDTFAHKTDYRTAPDQLLVNWPQEVLGNYALDNETYAVILSHDPKIDDEALKILLPSKVRYIGALGSKKTHAKRVERLKDYGFSDEEIDRIHAPIGLHIGAMSAKEIALSVISEVVKIKNLF
ncbi:XdhC family protein [Roseivirga sp. E12]|uniref:XdhC family protein n=1 Tax=Roseivirga sp. E12 TaxID=2819237 RepID=UPI001ABBEEF2|nr:XdhC family protein [Roseivirga sp. E12]MBO3697374.1 XdhC family protein [Roseivirga sp. E12]